MCERFLYTISVRPPSFFASNVRSLCIPGDIATWDAERILTVCQGVINLACWPMGGKPLFPLISTLRPERLSINTSGLFGMNTHPDFRHPFFQNVTHLEIVDWLWTSWSGLELLPRMTHLALDLDNYNESVVARLRRILESCRSLLVCLCLAPSDNAMIEASNVLAEIEDVRLVILSEADVLENWETSLRGGNDACHWEFAEELIAAKSGVFRHITRNNLLTSLHHFSRSTRWC